MKLAVDNLDLRTNPNEAGIELKVGTSLFAVVDPRNPGTCGPYFTDRSRALLWGFYISISNDRLKPRRANDMSIVGRSQSWKPGLVATDWAFPLNQQVILEIVLNRTVVFNNLMIDPNPFSYVKYRYGIHDPLSSTVHLNIDNDNVSLAVKQFADDTSWLSPSKAKLSYYGLMTMFPQTHTKNPRNAEPPSWIALSAPGMIDANRSFTQLFNPIPPLKVTAESYHETIVEVGIRIHAPQELTAARYYYPVDWERMWLFFTAWLYQRFTIAQINQAFPAFLEQVSASNLKTLLPPVTHILMLDANVVSVIIKWCATLKDAVALLSISRNMRFSIYQKALIQSNLRQRFLSPRNIFFITLANQESPDREHILGLPRKSEKVDKWWLVGGVLFNEDFQDSPLEPHLVLPLIRATNSFIAMFGMLYSLSHYSTLPRLANLVLNHNDSHGLASMSLKATARMPEYMPTGQRTAMEMINATTIVDYPHTISLIDSRGSWIHDIAMPYFFLEANFNEKLQSAKAFEKQRYDINMYYLKLERSAGRGGVKPEILPAHQQALKTPLINQLFMYRGDEVLAYFTCYMSSGMAVDAKRAAVPRQHMTDYVELIFNHRVLSNETVAMLMGRRLSTPYVSHTNQGTFSIQTSLIDDDRFQPHPYLVGGDDLTPYEILGSTSMIIMRFDLTKTHLVDEVYYHAYMSMVAFIRFLVNHERVTASRWSPNF